MIIRLDLKILTSSFLLFLLSLLILRSVSPELFVPQLIFGTIALIVYIVISQLDFRIFSSLHTFFSIFSTSLLILTYIIGEITRGTRRWIDLGLFNLQPSEIAKPFLLTSFIVIYFSPQPILKKIISITIYVIIPALLIFFQPDLGTFLVLSSGLLVVFFSRWQLPYLLLLFILAPLVVFPVYKYILKDYQRDRIITFINPYADPANKGYQVIQSVISVGSGGMLGKGLGQGSQSQLRFLPEQQTDFIFASLSEELGLVGGSIVLLLYGYVFYQIFQISQKTTQALYTSVCMGILGMLTFQVLINIGMNIGVAPVTGITLPFMSYGGSSLISSAVLLGIVSSISHDLRPRL